ncbi:MAG: hypothetical protein U0003_02535 [Vampirovibrionales bacterium]
MQKFWWPSGIHNPNRFKQDFTNVVKEREFPEAQIGWYEAPNIAEATQDMALFWNAHMSHMATFTDDLEPALHWTQWLHAPKNWDGRALFKRLPKPVQNNLQRIAYEPFGVFVFASTPQDNQSLWGRMNRLSKVLTEKVTGKPDEWLTFRQYNLDHSIALKDDVDVVVLGIEPNPQLKKQLNRVFLPLTGRGALYS